MNKNSLIKYVHDGEKGLMHYVIFEGEVVALSFEESRKVDYIRKNGTLDITFKIDSKEFDTLPVEVITDQDYVNKVYNYMIETNNAYFKDGFDELCVIKIKK